MDKRTERDVCQYNVEYWQDRVRQAQVMLEIAQECLAKLDQKDMCCECKTLKPFFRWDMTPENVVVYICKDCYHEN